MPVYHIACVDPSCDQRGVIGRKILRKEELAGYLNENRCSTCGSRLRRVAAAPGLSVVERIDPGRSPRAIERPVGLAELQDEHDRRIEGK